MKRDGYSDDHRPVFPRQGDVDAFVALEYLKEAIYKGDVDNVGCTNRIAELVEMDRQQGKVQVKSVV